MARSRIPTLIASFLCSSLWVSVAVSHKGLVVVTMVVELYLLLSLVKDLELSWVKNYKFVLNQEH